MSGIDIFGGIGLILFGVRFLRKGLDRLFGGNLALWLSRMVSTRLGALAGGLGVGMAVPSSTGIALIVTQIFGTAKLPIQNILAALLGANIGITLAVQLLALKLQDYAGLLIVFGVIGFQFLKREAFRGIGQCVLALGFVFLAIKLIGNGAQSFASSPELTEALSLLRGHPLLVLSAVCVITVILQSSTATIGLGLGLSASGLLPPDIMIPWVLGTVLGLSITFLLAGWNTLEGRRLGVANLLTKIVVILPLALLPTAGLALFGWMPGGFARQTAMFYTAVNLIIALVFVPILGVVVRLCRFLIQESNQSGLQEQEGFLDDRVLDSPSLALARATRETLRMADRVRLMLENFWAAFCRGDREMGRRIQKEDDAVDRMHLQLNDYLGRISEGKNESDTHWQFALLSFSNEIESAGDLIDKHLCDHFIKLSAEGILLEAADRDILAEACHRLLKEFELATGLLTSRDPEKAHDLLCSKETFNEWSRQVQREHYEQLHSPGRNGAGSSVFFLDFLNAFRGINKHISSIAYALCRIERRDSETAGRSPVETTGERSSPGPAGRLAHAPSVPGQGSIASGSRASGKNSF